MFTFCGPEKEGCIANQTLKDKNCLIPCTGLYADITEDSLKQSTQAFEKDMKKGKFHGGFCILIAVVYLRFLQID